MSVRLEELLKDTEYRLICGSLDSEAGNIIWDSRKVCSGDVFVAVMGRSDGTQYVQSTIEKGASAVVIDEHQSLYTDEQLTSLAASSGAAVVEMPDSRKALGILSANMYSHPEKSLELYGITGTKGKTTSAFMLHMILQKTGRKPGLMGTVCNMMGDKKIPAEHTTPEAPVTYAFMGELRDNGYDSLVMEVSSLGLKLDRGFGLNYKAACFTNLYRDHVGGIEHPDEEDYFRSKLKIFDTCEFGIVNADCNRFTDIYEYASSRCRVITYSISNDADIRAEDIVNVTKNGISGTSFTLVIGDDRFGVFVPIPGRFNVYNALCALSCAHVAGIGMEDAARAIEYVRVPGRLQPVDNNRGINVLVDYAHNGEALANVITTAKEFTKGRVITVFGCGGDRPPERRFEMGRISGEMSDLTIVTSDNPRTEDPLKIIDDILTAVNKTGGSYETVPDRKEAIARALSIAEEGDTVLLAGKGHEDYQEINGVKHHFDDHEVAAELLADE